MNAVSTQFCRFAQDFFNASGRSSWSLRRTETNRTFAGCDRVLTIQRLTPSTTGSTLRLMRRDPIELEIFKNLYHSIAEEMGAALRRTAFSPNIKERRDYSCAVFDGAGEVIAMGDHMPVHLGSMPMSVRAAIAAGEMEPGDVVMLNDPFRGGTHLPDITLVAPVYVREAGAAARERPPIESGFLRGFARPSCRCGRSVSRLDGTVPRDLSGRLSHSSGEADAGGER